MVRNGYTLLTLKTGPQTFRPKDAPRYVPAEITIIVCWGACLLDLYFIWWWYRRQNAKKARIRASPEYVKLDNQEYVKLRIPTFDLLNFFLNADLAIRWLDLTDMENHEFVYTL